MANKQFSERLNHELDTLGLPLRHEERVQAFTHLLKPNKLSRFQAESFLNGVIVPDYNLLSIIAAELGVNAEWLIGKSKERHKHN